MPRPPLESAAELAGMFDPEEFGQSVTVTRPNASTFVVRGIFDRGHVAVDAGMPSEISTAQPRLLCQESEVAEIDPELAYQVQVGADLYRVIDVQPEDQGPGTTLLILHRV